LFFLDLGSKRDGGTYCRIVASPARSFMSFSWLLYSARSLLVSFLCSSNSGMMVDVSCSGITESSLASQNLRMRLTKFPMFLSSSLLFDDINSLKSVSVNLASDDPDLWLQ